MTNTLHLSELAFEVRRSTPCWSLGSTVERDGSHMVSAALKCAVELPWRMRGRSGWVYVKLAEKELLTPPVVARDFVPGALIAALKASAHALVSTIAYAMAESLMPWTLCRFWATAA